MQSSSHRVSDHQMKFWPGTWRSTQSLHLTLQITSLVGHLLCRRDWISPIADDSVIPRACKSGQVVIWQCRTSPSTHMLKSMQGMKQALSIFKSTKYTSDMLGGMWWVTILSISMNCVRFKMWHAFLQNHRKIKYDTFSGPCETDAPTWARRLRDKDHSKCVWEMSNHQSRCATDQYNTASGLENDSLVWFMIRWCS